MLDGMYEREGGDVTDGHCDVTYRVYMGESESI